VNERDEGELDALAERLFEAGRAEPVPPAARARAFETLGLAGPPPPAGSTGSGASSAWLKWGGLAVLAIGAGAAFTALREPEPVTVVPPRVVLTQARPLNEAPSAISIAPSAATASESSPLPPPPAASASAARLSAKRAPSPAGDALAAELAALDRARAALRGGDAPGALALLRDYERAHPSGALRSEALLLRVEALVRAGRKAEAERIAAPIIAQNPEGFAARRLQGLLE
jgi:hypothetical protein